MIDDKSGGAGAAPGAVPMGGVVAGGGAGAMGGAVAATTAAGASGSDAGQPRDTSAPWPSWAGYR